MKNSAHDEIWAAKEAVVIEAGETPAEEVTSWLTLALLQRILYARGDEGRWVGVRQAIEAARDKDDGSDECRKVWERFGIPGLRGK